MVGGVIGGPEVRMMTLATDSIDSSQNDQKILIKVTQLYRAFSSVCCKVLKMNIWKIPFAVGLTLRPPTAEEGSCNL